MTPILRSLAPALIFCALLPNPLAAAGPPEAARTESPGNLTYHIDPTAGDDGHTGLAADQAWKNFAPLNRLELAPGDRVEIHGPGAFHDSLELAGGGTAAEPIEVRFAPGRYDFHPGRMFRDTFAISNTHDDPQGRKAVALLLRGVRHARISGPGARIVCRGKMIQVCLDESRNVTLADLAFDYHRPTVSEFRVLEAGADHALLGIHPDSAYAILEGRLTWQGEGWSHTEGLGQELEPATGRVHRLPKPLGGLTATGAGPFRVRVEGPHRLRKNRVYQIRDPFRDCVGVFTRHSRDIRWQGVRFHFIHGMGVVSQFSENLRFESVSVAPDPASGRTCAAWADCFHFSGCRGRIVIENCRFSGAQDDAVNVHGTHLRVVETLGPKRIKVRFMHRQTYGFPAYHPGDEIDFVHADSLEPYAGNRVVSSNLVDPREIELTLENPVPEGLREHDVIENLTWTPEVEIRGCEVRHIPTRGFLLTTRRRVLVEDNDFHATRMSAVLVENDAEGWYESGAVRDMTIRRNRFFGCGGPVVKINPRNRLPNPAVHRNIRIEDNRFELRGGTAISAHGTRGLHVTGNTFIADPPPARHSAVLTDDCEDVLIKDNRYSAP